MLTQAMVQRINYENSPCNKDCQNRCVGCKKGCKELLLFNMFDKIEWNDVKENTYNAIKHDDSGRKRERRARKSVSINYLNSKNEFTRVGLNS